MLLAKLQIRDLVTNQINVYLNSNELTFSELKTHLLNKIPVPPVHSIIITTINQAHDADKKEAEKLLETRAYGEQLRADEEQKKHDQKLDLEDTELKARLTRELNHIPTQIDSIEIECDKLRGKLNILLQSAQSPKDNTAAILRLQNSIRTHEIKIRTLYNQKKTIHDKLHPIETRAQTYISKQTERHQRERARSIYKALGTGLTETLSVKNAALLLKNISTQQDELEKKREELTIQAEQINFGLFLKQLALNLKTIKLPPQEVLALQNVLKFIEQHLKFEKQALLTAEMLNQKKAAITVNLQRLTQLRLKLERLKNNNPSLTAQNKKYTNSNTTLKKLHEKNKNLSQTLGNPALLLFALTLLTTIPLILMINGVIPFFASAVLMYFLFISPPSLLLIATTGLTIASAIYTFRANAAEIVFKRNIKAIAENDKKRESNLKDAQTIEKNTIPNLEAQIKKEEVERDNLEASTKQLPQQAQQAYQQASVIEPVRQSQLPVIEQERARAAQPASGSQASASESELSSEEEDSEQEEGMSALSPS